MYTNNDKPKLNDEKVLCQAKKTLGIYLSEARKGEPGLCAEGERVIVLTTPSMKAGRMSSGRNWPSAVSSPCLDVPNVTSVAQSGCCS